MKKILSTIAVIAGWMAFGLAVTPVVHAEKTLEQILLEKGILTKADIESLKKSASASSSSDGYRIKTGSNGFQIKSEDGDFDFGVGGRVQTDVNFFFPNNPNGNGMEVRRVRLKGYGRIYGDWQYKAEIDFAEYSKIDLTDGWLAYTGIKGWTTKIGHQKVPWSLQSEASSNWQTFQERAQTDAFIDTSYLGRRRLGMTVQYADPLFYGRAGAFAAGINEDGGFNQSFGTAFRGLVAPINEKERHFHVGGSVHYRDLEVTEDTDIELQFKYHPEAHIGGKDPAGRYWIDAKSMNEKSILGGNAEIAGYWGPLHGQAEYVNMNVERLSGRNSLSFHGAYAQLGYFLTGEHMHWKQKAGQWKRVKVLNPVGRGGGIGAWEVAGRFSYLDLVDEDIDGGRARNWTAALNWWANQNIMFRLNYVYSDRDPGTSNTAIEHDYVHAVTARAQVVF
ncbi:MAG: OprO/OprP family phosphate-selective porin [Methylococcales bacterium]|nr:OprO/OprP family phosphate-selective porin [Methylococcales bacterium]